MTLSFGLTRDFPVGCLLCLVKEVIYSPLPRIKAESSPPCLKPVELGFFDDAPEVQKCEHSSSQLLGSPCEGGSDAHFVGVKCVPSDWLSSVSIHSFKAPDSNWLCHPLTKFKEGRELAKNWIMLCTLFQGDGSEQEGWFEDWIPWGSKLFGLGWRDDTNSAKTMNSFPWFCHQKLPVPTFFLHIRYRSSKTVMDVVNICAYGIQTKVRQ